MKKHTITINQTGTIEEIFDLMGEDITDVQNQIIDAIKKTNKISTHDWKPLKETETHYSIETLYSLYTHYPIKLKINGKNKQFNLPAIYNVKISSRKY